VTKTQGLSTEAHAEPTVHSASTSAEAIDVRHYRRTFMKGVARVLGVGTAAQIMNAQTGSTPPTPSAANDLNILNYALTLELLEATFYTQGLARFSSSDFAQSMTAQSLRTLSQVSATPPPSGATDTSLAQDIYAYLSLVRNHEQAHVRTLQSVIRSLGGTPVTPPTFTFPYNNVDEFITLAATLENTGVAAYNGAIPMLSNPALVTASETIATVEARHASYLNRLRGMNPFPDAFDTGRSMAEILQVAAQFIAA
jgi:rubrerythrin